MHKQLCYYNQCKEQPEVTGLAPHPASNSYEQIEQTELYNLVRVR